MIQLLGQVGGGFAVGLTLGLVIALAAVVLRTEIASFARTMVESYRVERKRERDTERTLATSFSEIQQQHHQDAHQTRVLLLRAAHEAMLGQERQQ